MKNDRKPKIMVIAVLLLTGAMASYAESNGPDRMGVVFNTPGILLELEPYQEAGVGIKAYWGDLAVRGLLGLRYERGNRLFDLSLGSTIEYHVLPGTVSPYFGGGIGLSYQRVALDEEAISSIETEIGPVFGVELSILPSLGVFAEYALSLRLAHSSVSGPDDESAGAWNYSFGTRLGNRGAIGIVVYFFDRTDSSVN